MKEKVKKGWLVACACACAGLLFAGSALLLPRSEVASADEPGKVLYYVDCGNFTRDKSGTGENPTDRITDDGHVETGYPRKEATGFMTANNLSFGSSEDVSAANTLYNSTTDNLFGEDAVTKKSWGLIETGDWNSWRYVITSSESEQTGFKYSRVAEEKDFYVDGNKGGEKRDWFKTHDNAITYRFEVDDSTTELVVLIGMRTGKGWGTKTAKVQINGGQEQDASSLDNDDRTYRFHATGQAEDGKNYITVAFPVKSGSDPSVSWIMIGTKEHELFRETCDLVDFVKKNDTQIKGQHSADGEVTLDIDSESQTRINNAAIFDTVEITATYNEVEFKGNVTVLPKDTAYFVNVGSGATNGPALADEQYEAGRGYGYTTGHGKVGWENNSYDESCCYGENQVPVEYQFDISESGTYAVIVGSVGHWGQYKEMLVYLDDVAQAKHLSANASSTGNATYGKDITVDSDKTALKVKVSPTDPPVENSTDYIITYILIYKANRVTFDLNDGTGETEGYYEIGATGNLPTPTKTGYTFGGWFKTESEEFTDQVNDLSGVTENVELHAKWTAKTYQVKLNAGDHGSFGDSEKTVQATFDQALTISETPTANKGYEFKGWKHGDDDFTSGNNWTFDEESPELTAVYEAKKTQVTFELGDSAHGTLEGNSPQTYTYDQDVTLPEPTANKGYTFDGWYKDGGSGEQVESGKWAIEDESLTLTAKWVAKQTTVTFQAGDHGTLGAGDSSKTFTYDQAATLPTPTPAKGYEFKEWQLNGVKFELGADNKWNKEDSSLTLTAVYTAKTYNFTWNAGTDGTSTTGSASAAFDGSVTLPTVTANAGKKFEGWYIGETKIENAQAIWAYVAAHESETTVTFTAKYSDVKYTVHFNSHEGSTVADKTNVEYNTTITAPTDPTREGYTFGGWYKDESCTQKFDFENDKITEETTLHAKWTAVPAENPGNSGSTDNGTTDNGTDKTDDKSEEKGCGSAIAAPVAMIASAVLMVGVALVIRKKHSEN